MARRAPDEIPAALAATWHASIGDLPPAARALLDLLAWLAPAPLPRFLFDHAAAPEGTATLFADSAPPGVILAELCAARPSQTDTEPEDAIAALRALSLLQPATETEFASEGRVHRMLALITRERQDEDTRTAALTAALALVNTAAVGEPDDVRHWTIWEPLQPHVGVLVDHAEAAGIGEPTARLLNALGLFLKAKAQYAEAEPLMRRALAIDEASFGPEHPTVAVDLNNLAGLLQDTNRPDEAEPLMRRALAIDEASFGPGHPTVAIDLNNLATILYSTNRLREAESLMLLALAIDETGYGPEHPNVAIRLNNLAALLQ
ncbi:MAG: tetratricopeptide repeat protein, partial [Thiocapsa sp.]